MRALWVKPAGRVGFGGVIHTAAGTSCWEKTVKTGNQFCQITILLVQSKLGSNSKQNNANNYAK